MDLCARITLDFIGDDSIKMFFTEEYSSSVSVIEDFSSKGGAIKLVSIDGSITFFNSNTIKSARIEQVPLDYAPTKEDRYSWIAGIFLK